MAIVLVVRTMDVNYATVDGATVNASFDGGTATKMTKVDKGAFELPVTAGVKKVEVSVTLAGTMLFAERISAPKMLAIYMPNRTTKTLQRGNEEMQQVPIPYHVFFHPSTGHFAPTNYPFSHDYMDLIGRYVFYNQQWNLGKAMANQHEASGKKVVFVFPVGGRVTSFGNMNTQAGILRVLQEVNYFVQRMQGVPFPLQPLGKVGISGFSSGFRSVASVLGSRRVDVFHDKLLSEVYSFDGVFMTKDANKKDIVDVPATLNTINAIKAWLRGGARGRTIRIYSQSRIWLDQLRGSITNPTTVNGADNSMEVFGDSGTLLHTPSVMWRSVEPAIERIGVDVNQLQKSVHQFIPAMFMQHAIKMSKL